jgi:hypothetical protein
MGMITFANHIAITNYVFRILQQAGADRKGSV